MKRITPIIAVALVVLVAAVAVPHSDQGPQLAVDYSEQLRKVQNTCSTEWNGKMYVVSNLNRSHWIRFTIEITHVYNGNQRSEQRVVDISPYGETLVGCDVPGPTAQRFDYKIVAARWYDPCEDK